MPFAVMGVAALVLLCCFLRDIAGGRHLVVLLELPMSFLNVDRFGRCGHPYGSVTKIVNTQKLHRHFQEHN